MEHAGIAHDKPVGLPVPLEHNTLQLCDPLLSEVTKLWQLPSLPRLLTGIDPQKIQNFPTEGEFKLRQVGKTCFPSHYPQCRGKEYRLFLDRDTLLSFFCRLTLECSFCKYVATLPFIFWQRVRSK
ncbi:hypothetical protein E4T56_gene13714 [Termitomyces sp. T112]|nr:hypothetical protein E4T56_gene13714 [Termitomyces sp. T112]